MSTELNQKELSVVACLCYVFSLSASEEMTRPVLVKPCTPALLEVRNGSHPCITHTHNGGEYIPNDVLIEGQRSCLLVTGPNMGGKSTLMRQTGLLVVLAQLVRMFVQPSTVMLMSVFRGAMFQLQSAS